MSETLPLSAKTLNRMLVAVVVILALALGYYHNQWHISERQRQRLQLRYTQLLETQQQ